MGIGAGVLQGVSVDTTGDMTPSGDLVLEDDGVTYNEPEYETPHYLIEYPDAFLVFRIQPLISELQNPRLVLYSMWGPTDFDLIDDGTGRTIISEQSGFDSTGWIINVSDVAGPLRLTNFDTDDGVDGTQAAWYPYLLVYDQY